MSSTETINKQKLSTTLITFAWIVEVFAVLTGLFIATMLAIETLDKIVSSRPIDQHTIQLSDYINTIIAALPFVLVAVVELAKIPVAQAAYNTISKLWKTIFFITLVFLAFITFETTFNGFERNFSNLTFVINKYKDELESKQERLNEIKRQKNELQSLTLESIESSYNDRRIELSTDRDEQVSIITDRIAALKAQVNTETTIALKNNLSSLKEELSKIRSERDIEIRRVTNRLDKLLNTATQDVSDEKNKLQDQIQRLNQQIIQERQKQREEIEEASFFDSKKDIQARYSKIINNYETERQSYLKRLDSLSVVNEQAKIQTQLDSKIDSISRRYDIRIKTINEDISKLEIEIAKSISLSEKDIKTSIDSLYEQQKNIETKFDIQLSENNDERERRFEELNNNEIEIKVRNEKITDISDQIVEIRNSINQEVGNNQIYRITRSWTGIDAASDISRKDIALTASIWFGSLAAIVALTGILLALASCVLRDEGVKSKNKSNRRSLKNLSRYRILLAYLYKKFKNPKIKYVEVEKPVVKEVIKEVPVEKVVSKEVIKEVPIDKIVIKEVPKEIVKNRIVHVPIYTNDKSLLSGNVNNEDSSENEK